MYENPQAANPLNMFREFMEASLSPLKEVMGECSPVMEMCRKMTQAVQQTNDTVQQTSENTAYATPELRDLFNDWLEQVEKEALTFLSGRDDVSVEELSLKLGITKESAIFLLSKLTRQGKLELRGGLKKTQDQPSCTPADEIAAAI